MTGAAGNNSALEEIAELEALGELIERKRKDLQAKVRRARKERFYGMDRRQLIQPGMGGTIDELAATLGFRDDRTCRERIEKRGVFVDDELNGFVLWDDFLERQAEHVRRCRENENG